MKNKTFLITRPAHDLVTNYLFFWSKGLVDIANSKGAKVIDLQHDKATQKELTGRLKKTQPDLVMLNGHGNENVITGHDNTPLIGLANAKVLSGSVIYARSCSSAHTLGAAIVAEGAKAFIGYSRPFYMCYDQNMVQHPLKDKVAALFLEPSNHVVSALQKGHTASEASVKSKSLSMKTIQTLISSNASDEEKVYARYMLHNMRSQVCLGDQAATI